MEKETKAKRIENIFDKYKKWYKIKYETTPFKEPVLFFIRRTGEVEFYENATAGMFKFKHSDGKERFIILNPVKKLKFGFAERMFKGYICYEDSPIALPDNPVIITEEMNMVVEKSIFDIKQFEAKALTARGQMWWKIGLAISIIIIAIAILLILKPQKTPQIIQMAQPTIQNVTATVIG